MYVTPTKPFPAEFSDLGNKIIDFSLGLIPLEDNGRSECYVKVRRFNI